MVRAGVQVRAVVRVVRPLERINHSNNRKYPRRSRARRSDLARVSNPALQALVSCCTFIESKLMKLKDGKTQKIWSTRCMECNLACDAAP